MGPNFKEKFSKIRTYGSREQCMGLTEKTQMLGFFLFSAIQTQPW